MEFLLQLQQSLTILHEEPQKFNQISKQAILELSKIHNTHNRLLPTSFVADLIEKMYAIDPFENRKYSLEFAFYYNIIRHIVIANFYQLKDNKIFAVIVLIYAEKLSQFYHSVKDQQKSLALIKHIAQIAIINEITLKYVQRTKIFFPEFIRSLKITIEKLQFSITRNIRHSSKVQSYSSQFSTTQAIIKIAFSKDTQKSDLIFILIGLLNYILKQASSFFTSNLNKKELIKLNEVQQIISEIDNLLNKLPSNIKSQVIIPAQFKKYQQAQGEQNKEEEPIFLEEPIQVRELTPRFYDEEEATQTKLLRKKKNKLEKKMQQQLRQNTHERLQLKKVIENVKKQKVQQRVKKEIFILQKQTEQAKKAHKQMKKVKSIKKEVKPGRKGKR